MQRDRLTASDASFLATDGPTAHLHSGWAGNGPHDIDGDVLLTGATGFLGMELLARYLERTDRTILALVRARGPEEAQARIDAVLELLFGEAGAYRPRVIPVPGDLERDGLGLEPAELELITQRASELVHCAATVSFSAGLPESRQINVEGTRHLLALANRCAQRGVLRRLVHVSTAYVAGTYEGEFAEDDLWVGQQFRNPYERSKYEAEQLVRQHAPGLPGVTIVRPSIIVGNVLYVPLRGFAQRKLRVLPAERSAPVDVVPVDYVADAIIHLSTEQQQGLSTYHLVAADRATTVARLVELSARGLHRRPPPVVPPALYRAGYPLLLACSGRRRRAALRRVAPFLPYYTMRVRYRRDLAAQKLDPARLRPPALENYYHRLLGYALHANWGKRPLPRPQTAADSHLAAPRA
jgi:long-chain acyl-CoA synthetase